MRLRHLQVIIFILLFVLVSVKTEAVLNNFYFINLRVSDGLPASVTTSFVQDSLGFIWIGTSDGLCRYDGANFRTYRHEPGNPNSLSENYITNLYLDSKGNLWVMTSYGLDHFNLKEHVITRFRDRNSELQLADNSPTDIIETNEGSFYISSYYSGISIINEESTGVEFLNTASENGAALSSNFITCMEITEDSMLVIGYRDSNIDFHHIKTGITTPITINNRDNFSFGTINTMVYDHKGHSLWIGTNKGLYHYNITSGDLTDIPLHHWLSDNEVTSLLMDVDKYLWIGTQNNGLLIANQENLIHRNFHAGISHYQPGHQPGSLSYRTITAIFHDNTGHKWLGTHGGGINYAENISHRFKHLKHEPSVENALNYNKVWGMAEDWQGNIWLGTDGHGINIWNPEEGVVERHKHEPGNKETLTDNAILSAYTDHQGHLWFGTYTGGLNRYDINTGQFVHYTAPDELPVNDIRVIYEDRHNRLWIGMNQGGLAKYNREDDRFERITEAGLRDIRALYFDHEYLWLGSFGQGLFRYQPETGEFIKYQELIDEHDQIINSGIIFTIYGENQYLWLGTRNQGMCRINSRTGEISHFTEKDGLSNNTIHVILSDHNNDLWITTNKGISRFNAKNETFINYYRAQGVQPEEFHNGSGLVTKSGMFLFGGNNGVNFFHPDSIIDFPSQGVIRFTNLKILNHEVIPGYDAIMNKSIEYEPEVNLKHFHRVITFEFQTINYPSSTQSSYEYMLEGYEKTWNLIEGQNSATYRNLPPGEYTFRVRNHLSKEENSISEAILKVKMAPPFWKTIPAYLFYLLSLSIVIMFAFRIKMQQFKIRNQLSIERELRQKEKNMHEERLEFFTNISHELRTPLTIISVAIDDIAKFKNSIPKISKSINAASINAKRLMELISKLLEFRQVETGITDLSVTEINLNSFLPEYLHNFRGMAKNQQINLKQTLPVNDIILWADPEKLSMILNNIISNAFKNTPEKGSIIINADETDQWIEINIEDNGKGIPASLQKDIFKRYMKLESESTGSGIGLALTKSLMELHHGTISVKSEPGQGSTFTIRFQKENTHFSGSLINQKEGLPGPYPQKNRPEQKSNDLAIQQKQILLVDDNKEIVDLLQDKLKREYNILTAYHGKQAIQIARENCPDIIIMDIMMPEMDGIEACHQLKTQPLTSHIPVILLTAKGTEEDEIAGLKTKADDYISKPFNFNILQARIKSIIENRRLQFNYFSTISEPDKKLSPGINAEIVFLKEVETKILDNYTSTDASVFDLAVDMGFSRTTLYRKIRALTGLSINAFIRSVKIKKSAKLISEGMNVSEAAYSAGFNDLKYFRECFKKQMGKSPSAFKIK